MTLGSQSFLLTPKTWAPLLLWVGFCLGVLGWSQP